MSPRPPTRDIWPLTDKRLSKGDPDFDFRLQKLLDQVEAHGPHEVGAASPFDAVVDRALATDVGKRRFNGIGEALAYLSGLGLESVNVFVRNYRGATSGNTAYTEAADFACPSSVHLFAMRGARSAVGLNQNETGVYWNLGAFRPLPTGVSHSPCDFYIHNFYTVQLDPNVNQRFRGLMLFNTHLLLGEPGAVVCTTFDAVLSSLQCIGTTTLASNYCNMVECDVSLGSQSGAGAGFTLGSTNLDMIGCKLFCRSSSGTHTLTLPTSYTLDVYVPSAGGQNRNGDTPTSNLFINVPASSRGSIRCIDRGMSGHYKVTTTGAPARLELDGDFDDINVAHSVDELVADVVCDQFTCVVPAAGMSPHKLKIQARGTVDITGPAVIDVTLQRTPICFLRGGRISGHISLGASVAQPAPAGTRLQFIGADDCNVDVSGHASGAPAGHQPWWLDGNSDRNILDFAGASTFPTAGTNDGVGNLVRTT